MVRAAIRRTLPVRPYYILLRFVSLLLMAAVVDIDSKVLQLCKAFPTVPTVVASSVFWNYRADRSIL